MSRFILAIAIFGAIALGVGAFGEVRPPQIENSADHPIGY